jgi:hypothetical protein
LPLETSKRVKGAAASNHSEPNVWKGALAGLIAGLVASWTMDSFQDIWLLVSSGNDSSKKENSSAHHCEESKLKAEQSSNQTAKADDKDEDDTIKTASVVSEAFFGHELTPYEKKIAGPAVHYAVGATVGIVYGLAAELAPKVTSGAGFPTVQPFGWWSMKEWSLCSDYRRGQLLIHSLPISTRLHHILFSERLRRESDT